MSFSFFKKFKQVLQFKKIIMRVFAFSFSVSVLVSVVTAKSHLRLKEMMISRKLVESASPTPPVELGYAGKYAIIAKSGISTVPFSFITGNIAVSPIAASAITGFDLVLDSGGQFSTASQITGQAHAADYGGDIATALTNAVGDMELAYADAAGRPNADPERINLMSGSIGGQSLTTGVYTFTTAITIDSDVTFQGGPDDVFILQTTGALTLAANTKVILLGGARAENIFWQVAGNVEVLAGAHLEGILLIKTDAAFITGSSLNGSILTQTACTLQKATIMQVCNTAQTGVDCCGASDCDTMFPYDPKIGHTKKTNSYMPFLPILDGYFQTHNTYRFLSVREQVLTVIGEAKHGLWRIHDNGMVRLYRKHDAAGVPVGTDVYSLDPSIQAAVVTDYKPFLAPGPETGDAAGWGGYRYSQDADGDGQAAFVDVPIYHPYFEDKYDDHVPIDLSHWYCTMSGANFTNARSVWEYATKQPNANVVGPLGKRAGLDINEHYTNIIRFEMFPDAKFWVQVGLGDVVKDVFDQQDIDDGSMSMDIAYRALDTSKVNIEVYLIERPFFNVPYQFVTVVIDNKENDDMQYVRPGGLYWQELVGKSLTNGLKTVMSFDPVMPVIDGDSQVDKIMRYTPFYGMNHLDRPNDDGSGGWCKFPS
jgi:hypothetical protein